MAFNKTIFKANTTHTHSIYCGLHCPKCYESNDNLLINYTVRTENTDYISCKCGWTGKIQNLLKKGEAKNKKRTELIDRILK